MWPLVIVMSCCLIVAACEEGRPPVATIHLNCLEGATALCKQLDSGNGKILVERRAILSDQDFTRIELMPDEVAGGVSPILAVGFSERAAETLAQTTRENIGRRLMLVADGRVLMSTKILEPVQGMRGQLVLDMSQTEAKGLVARIRAN